MNEFVILKQVNKPAAFTVDFNGAQGKLDAMVVAPSGAEDQAIIQEVDRGQKAFQRETRFTHGGAGWRVG